MSFTGRKGNSFILEDDKLTKIMEMSPTSFKRYQEPEILEKIFDSYPDIKIPKLYSSHVEVGENKILVTNVYEYIRGRSMLDIFPKLTRTEKLSYFIQLTDICAKIDSLGIIHMDIKPENIIVSENNEIYLIDFEFACFKHKVFSRGTPYYVAPEVVRQEVIYCDKADIFSLGVCFFAILYNRYPYSVSKTNLNPVKFRGYRAFNPIKITFEDEDFFSVLFAKMTQFDPKERADYDEIKKLLYLLEKEFEDSRCD